MKATLAIFSFLMSFVLSTELIWGANRVLSLDGRGDYVEIPHAEHLNISEAITLEGWIFLRNMPTGNAQAWISKYMGPISWDVHSDGFFISRDGNEDDMLSFSTPTEEWLHIACVYDGEKQEVYINGELVADREWPGSINLGTSPVQIGTHHGQYWPGMIDEVRIWRVARTKDEIQETIGRPLAGDEPNLVGYWNFDSGGANDGTTYGNDGMLEGDATISVAMLPDGFTPGGTSVIMLEDKIVNPRQTFIQDVAACLAKTALHRFTFDLKFDPAMLQAVAVEEGSFLSRDAGDETMWIAPKIDNENGLITNIQCLRTGETGVDEVAGTLAAVTFMAGDVGGGSIYVENLKFFSPDGEQIPAEAESGEIDIFPHGSISGRILDAEDQTEVGGVRIEVSNRWLRFPEVYSDMEGKYAIPVVAVGDVELKASRSGTYFSTTRTDIHVEPGVESPNVDFELKPIPVPDDPGLASGETLDEEIEDH